VFAGPAGGVRGGQGFQHPAQRERHRGECAVGRGGRGGVCFFRIYYIFAFFVSLPPLFRSVRGFGVPDCRGRKRWSESAERRDRANERKNERTNFRFAPFRRNAPSYPRSFSS
jgi:hypothetical protein